MTRFSVSHRGALRRAAAALLAGVLTGAATTPTAACTGAPTDPAHCINNNQAINGFSSFYQENILNPFDPLGLAPPPGDPQGGIGPPPGIAGFAAPDTVPSIGAPAEGPPSAVSTYVADERRVREFQQEKLDAGKARLDAATAAREAARAAYEPMNALDERRAQETSDWLDGKITYDQMDPANEPASSPDWKDKLRAARILFEETKAAEAAAQQNVDSLERSIAQTDQRIADAEAGGTVPGGTGMTGAFGGPDTSGYTYRAGERSTYNQIVNKGEGYTLFTGTSERLIIDGLVDGDVGAQYVRSATGHAESGPGTRLSHGTSDAYETGAALFGGNAFEVTNHFMREGLARNLRRAVENGEVPGTVETVPELNKEGKPTGFFEYKVTIPPEGLDAAKKYFDAMDSLFEGLQEDYRTTESDAERAEREADERRSAERHRRTMERLYPTTAADVKDANEPDRVRSVIEDVQGVIPLS